MRKINDFFYSAPVSLIRGRIVTGKLSECTVGLLNVAVSEKAGEVAGLNGCFVLQKICAS